MKILFMGTPEYAKESLKALVESGYEVIGAVTQPDKPQGRKMILTPPPVKEYALSCGISVYQPKTLKNEEFKILLSEINPDIIVVAAYGNILPQYVLDLPKYGCVNVHASLLPKYRGAAPINAAILNGESETGITTMQMDAGIDTGDILLEEKIEIGEYETFGELHDRLMVLGGKVLVDTLKLLEKGEITPQKQDNSESSYMGRFDNEFCRVDFNASSKEIVNKVRAFSPVPGAYTYLNGKKMKLFDTVVSQIKSENAENGEVIAVLSDSIAIKSSDGSVEVKTVQAEGSKKMSVKDYLRGNKIETGTVFGKKDG